MNSKENKKIKFLVVLFVLSIGFLSSIINYHTDLSKNTEVKK